jgi:uncharacterized membrane protein YphA (DoxX/SURF4 family)
MTGAAQAQAQAQPRARGRARLGVDAPMKIRTLLIAQALLGLTIFGFGLAKLCGADVMARAFEVMGASPGLRTAMGTLEIVGALALFVPRMAAFGAVLLACLTISATGIIIGHAAAQVPEPATGPQPRLVNERIYHVQLEVSRIRLA